MSALGLFAGLLLSVLAGGFALLTYGVVVELNDEVRNTRPIDPFLVGGFLVLAVIGSAFTVAALGLGVWLLTGGTT